MSVTFTLTDGALGHVVLGVNMVSILLIWFFYQEKSEVKQAQKKFYFSKIWSVALIAQMCVCPSGFYYSETGNSVAHVIEMAALTTVSVCHLLLAIELLCAKKDNSYMMKTCCKVSIGFGVTIIYSVVLVVGIINIKLGGTISYFLIVLSKLTFGISVYNLYLCKGIKMKELTLSSFIILLGQIIANFGGILSGVSVKYDGGYGFVLVLIAWFHYLPITICQNDILQCLNIAYQPRGDYEIELAGVDSGPTDINIASAIVNSTGTRKYNDNDHEDDDDDDDDDKENQAGNDDNSSDENSGNENNHDNDSSGGGKIKLFLLRQLNAENFGPLSRWRKLKWTLKCIRLIDNESESEDNDDDDDENISMLTFVIIADGLRLWFYFGFFTFMTICVIVTSTFTDIDYTNNYIYNRVGYNNICIYFDDPPITYIAATLFLIVLLPLYVYLLFDNLRVYFYYKTKKIISKRFYRIYTLCGIYEMCTFTLVMQVFATTPKESFLMHFIPYWGLLSGLALLAISHFVLFIKTGIIKQQSVLYYLGILYLVFGVCLISIKYIIGFPLIFYGYQWPSWTEYLVSVVDLLYVAEFFFLPVPIYIAIIDRLKFIKMTLNLH